MKKKIISFLLTLAIVFSSLVTTVCAANTAKFSDVDKSAWYFDDLSALTGQNTISGYPDGTFRPDEYVTRAEFVKILVGAMKYPLSSKYSFADTKNGWYSQYISSAIANGIILFDEYENGFSPDLPISRYEAARMIYRAARLSRSPAASPYRDTDDIYSKSLFGECLMQGSLDQNGERYFYPDSSLRRCEICSIAVRLVGYTSDKDGFVKAQREKYGILPCEPNKSPETISDFYALFLYMWQNEMSSFSLYYDRVPYSSKKAEKIYADFSEAFRLVSSNRPEYSDYMSVQCKRSGNQNFLKIDIQFTSDIPLSLEFEHAREARLEAKKVADEICRDLATQYEKACAIHDYLTGTVSYGGEDPYTPYSAYGALVNKSAVCIGYAAAFDLLCSYAGIMSFTVSNDNHAWNAVAVDGEILFFDATWDDPIPESETSATKDYCGVGLEKILESRDWDMWDYSIEYFD